MSRISKIGRLIPSQRLASPPRPRKQAARLERPLSARRCSLRVEQLEDRITPSVNPAAPLELDGNVTTTTAHDWDQIFADNNVNPPPVSGAVASAFVTDAVNSKGDDIFTGGGSKDTLGIQQGPWLFTDSKPQAKDDITHAYAALYIDPATGHQILYAGLDRYDNSGDATAGFWFFRNNITESPNVSGNGTGPFIGTHADGDILLVSDFTTGGSTSTIKVFRWTGDDATGSLVALNNGNPISGNTFAIVNGGAIATPWSFTNKSGENQPAHGEFLEEGVDLTALGLNACFSTFLAETRSSQSPTATLSDFVIGSFPLCSVSGTNTLTNSKFDVETQKGDASFIDVGVTNTGALPLYLKSVTDTAGAQTLLGNLLAEQGTNPAGPVESVSSDLIHNGMIVGSAASGTKLDPGDQVIFHIVRTVQAGDPDPTTGSVTFTLTGNADLSGDPLTADSPWTVNLFQPSASMTVTASPTSTSNPNQVITYTYMVTNTSSADSPSLVLSTLDDNNNPDPTRFTDTLLGNLEPDAIHAITGDPNATVAFLAPGASFTLVETRAIQPGDPSPLTNTATVAFTLAQNLGNFGNVIHAQAATSVTLLPHLTIAKTVTGDGTSAVIHPGDTASFTITVTNDGAGPATNVIVTDQLPEPDLLNWSASSSTFTTSVSAGDFLTATLSSLAAGATASVTVSAVVPLNIFGIPPGTVGNGDPLPSGLFELDGDVLDDPNVAGDDWSNTVFGNGGSSTAHSFVTDAFNSRTDDIFTGGGSKDTQGIQQGPWLFTDSKPQAKDDITHAYAALYTDPATGDQILYAGLDRYDNSGDATAGFWFFQNPISATSTAKGHPFTGTHADGDILLVSDFTTGGSISTIKVFKWVGDDATGSLVALNNGNPINGSTFAIVNSGPIDVPWSYTNKSGATKPDHGEFLEEGVNLSALGLNACFSSFLAETRSSQSPTATLSDFVIGNFNTCRLDLPNTATVSADGVAPITSNQALITVLPAGGMAQLPTARGSGAGTALLTDQELQSVVGQAIDQWRAAGVNPGRLSALEQVPIHVADITWGWLGLTQQGEIWIDRTAAGWGWSTASTPEAGRMDLLTVVTHEFGHILGLASSDSDVMATTLGPGVQRVPEALTNSATVGVPGTSATGTTISVGVPATTAPAVSHTAEPSSGPVRAPQTSPSRTETVDAVLATVVGSVKSEITTAAAQAGSPTLPAVVGAIQDGVSVPRSLGGGLLNLGRETFPLSPGTVDLDDIPTESDQDASGIFVPGLCPPLPRLDGGDALLDGGGEAQVGVGLRQQAYDACFADGSWQAEPVAAVESASAPDTVAASAALALVLGSYWSAPQAETQRRTRQRLLR